jgi:hypothetical protein
MFKVRLHRFIDEITGQFGELDTANNEVLDLSDYIVNLSITYSTKAPYETSTIKAKFKDIENILNSFRGANGWVTIHELEKETEKLIFLGVIASVGSGVIASQDGKISSMEITIQAQSWLSIIMKAQFTIVNDRIIDEIRSGLRDSSNVQKEVTDAINFLNELEVNIFAQAKQPPDKIKIDAGIFGSVEFFQKLVPILKDMLDPTIAIKTVYSLFSKFDVPPSISSFDLSKILIVSSDVEVNKYNITRAITTILAKNFNVINPTINGSLWSLIQSSFVAGFDTLIELFPSLEEVNVTTNDQNQPFKVNSQVDKTKKIIPCLIYRFKPLDDKIEKNIQSYTSTSNQRLEQQEINVNARNIQIDNQPGIEFNTTKPLYYSNSIDLRKYDYITPKRNPAIRVDNVLSFSIDYNTENRLNLVDITTKVTGVTPLIGTVTDIIYDINSINRYGASSFIETFPFFGREDDKELKDYAYDISKYYTALYADGHRLGNVRVQCYYAKQVRHGEYIEFVISNGLSTQYLRGYCISVTHSHSALNDGRIQQRTEFTLERAYYYEA